HLGGALVRGGAKEPRRLERLALALVQPADRLLAGDGHDAAHAGGDRSFAEDLEQADLTGAAHVGAAAKFEGAGVHLHHAHALVVLLAEERHGADRLGFVERHLAGLRLRVVADHPVHPRLDPLQGFRSEEHTSELQSRENLVCRLLLEKKKKRKTYKTITTQY